MIMWIWRKIYETSRVQKKGKRKSITRRRRKKEFNVTHIEEVNETNRNLDKAFIKNIFE